MSKVKPVRAAVAPLIALALSLGASSARAQSATLTGKVTNDIGAVVVGANVYIRELTIGATTNEDGVYAIQVPKVKTPPQLVTVTARFIGYTPVTRPITLTVGSHTEDFVLRSDPFRLEQMVVTGVADSTSTKNLPFSMGQVSADQVKDVPAANPIEALAGKVAGAKIETGVGNPGGTPAIRLRGSTNLQVGTSAPLIIIDGVIATSGIGDFDAQDIESIEILKGAAGAAFYGSNAANGVISITTKRGRSLAENHMTVTARTEYGQSGLGHWVNLNHGTQDQFNPDGSIQLKTNGNPVVDTTGFDDTPYPTSGPNRFRNQLQTWLSNNNYYNNDVQLGLRRGNTNFNSAFSTDHNGGILPFKDGQFKQNARLNVDQGMGDKFDMSASLTYGNQRNDYLPNSATDWFELLQAPPMVDLTHPNPTVDDTTLYYPVLPKYASPSGRANPLYQLSTQSISYRRERILASVAAHYRATDWLHLDATYGTDRLNLQQQIYTYRGALSLTSGQPTAGALASASNNNVSTNSQLRATATKVVGSIQSTTSVAYQLESETDNAINVGGTQLNFNAVPDLNALDPTSLSDGSSTQIMRTTDYMASQAFTLADRYTIDGLYRRDGSSLFGPQARWSDFYRLAGAYRLTQDIHIPGFQEIKLHAARGTAGLRPAYADQYETFTFTGTLPTPATLGNTDLKPAVLTENEFGVNADFANRYSAEVTYADRNTAGAFLQVPLSAAKGGFTSQWQNAADVGSHTLEASLQAHIFDGGGASYDITLTGDHTTQTILSMNRAPFRVSADNAQGQNVFWYQAGEPLGVIYGTKFVRSFAQLLQNPANAGAVASDYVVNPLGYLVKATLRGKPGELPIPYVDAQGNSSFILGDVNPDFNFGFANDLRLGAFAIHALFDGQQGGKIYNFTKQWMFQDLRSGDLDQTGKAASQKIAEGFYSTGLYNGLNPADYFVEDGSYVKLRELSVGYDLPTKWLPMVGLGRVAGAKISFIGRNVYTWTKYTGFDPDVTSGSDFNYRIDGFKYPPFRTFTGQFEVRF